MFARALLAAAGLSVLLIPAGLFAGSGPNRAGQMLGTCLQTGPVAVCPNPDCPNPDCPNAEGGDGVCPNPDCPNADCPKAGSPNDNGNRTGDQDGTGPQRDGSCRN